MMLIFIVTYIITNGPIIWLYVSEIVVDAALGLCLGLLWSVILLLSIFTGPLMESFLKPTGLFWIFGLASFAGAWFVHTRVRETSGLSDREKKMLYLPERSLESKSLLDIGDKQVDDKLANQLSGPRKLTQNLDESFDSAGNTL
jgi:hypothetical protein